MSGTHNDDRTVRVRPLAAGDTDEWFRMRLALWPDSGPDRLRFGMSEWVGREDVIVLVAERAHGLGGFAEVGTRPYAEGCDSSPVAYLEGWYVDPDLRRTGVGRALVDAAIAWARARGLTEFASDAHLDNDTSHRAHREIGFQEVERIVTYRRSI